MNIAGTHIDVSDCIAYSRNFALSKPDIGETEKEHILGLCSRLERLAASLKPLDASFLEPDERIEVAEAGGEAPPIIAASPPKQPPVARSGIANAEELLLAIARTSAGLSLAMMLRDDVQLGLFRKTLLDVIEISLANRPLAVALDHPTAGRFVEIRNLHRWDIGYTEFGACIQRKENGSFVKIEDVESIVCSTKPGITLIAIERWRQVEAEGWKPEHDDEHYDGALAAAAACYARFASLSDVRRNSPGTTERVLEEWPFDPEWWKPKDRIRDLTRAGALIAAEIDRLLRAGKCEGHAHG